MGNRKFRIDFTEVQFMTLWRWSRDHQKDSPEISMLYGILGDKFNRMMAREWYTDSLTAETEDEREFARQRYLDHKGVHPDFRWSKKE